MNVILEVPEELIEYAKEEGISEDELCDYIQVSSECMLLEIDSIIENIKEEKEYDEID